MISIALAFLIVGIGMLLAYLSERRQWNNGIDAKSGKPWVQFDVDSQGGRGYSSGARTIWISYPFIGDQ